MPDSYSVTAYGRMMSDRTRMEGYARALEATVRPGCTVLDIGTGTGILALLACRFGAGRVYAVDPADAIATAREVARANGMAGRIEFIQDLTTRISLPRPADVIVFDVRGLLPPFQECVATVRDARERLLAPGGALVPRADTLLAAPLEAEQAWDDAAGPAAPFGFDLSAARRAAVNEWTRGQVAPEQLLAEPRAWAVLDYRTVTDPDLRGAAEWTAAREGTAHGLAMWFEADLAEGIGFSSGPGTDTIYHTAFFPWPEPVELAAGDRVRVEIEARLVAGEYLWRWDSAVERPGRPALAFRQSTFLANPPAPGRLRKRADAFAPVLDEEGEVDAYLLSRMDGRATLGELARGLRERFPGRFATWEAALSRAGRLSEQYAR
ncbi:MAG: 50S ribosomal protein L11 methyltransferase [Longimicrobiaceae bacterium]